MCKKRKLNLNIVAHTKITERWDTDHNINHKTKQLLEENIREIFMTCQAMSF